MDIKEKLKNATECARENADLITGVLTVITVGAACFVVGFCGGRARGMTDALNATLLLNESLKKND